MEDAHDKVRRMLREAVKEICKTVLSYRSELTVEGLLGITLDKNEVFLVNINEQAKSDIPAWIRQKVAMAGDKSRGKTTPIAKRKKVNTSEKRDYPDDEDGTPNKVKKSEDDDSFEETDPQVRVKLEPDYDSNEDDNESRDSRDQGGAQQSGSVDFSDMMADDFMFSSPNIGNLVRPDMTNKYKKIATPHARSIPYSSSRPFPSEFPMHYLSPVTRSLVDKAGQLDEKQLKSIRHDIIRAWGEEAIAAGPENVWVSGFSFDYMLTTTFNTFPSLTSGKDHVQTKECYSDWRRALATRFHNLRSRDPRTKEEYERRKKPQLSCPECGDLFHNKKRLTDHMITTHSTMLLEQSVSSVVQGAVQGAMQGALVQQSDVVPTSDVVPNMKFQGQAGNMDEQLAGTSAQGSAANASMSKPSEAGSNNLQFQNQSGNFNEHQPISSSGQANTTMSNPSGPTPNLQFQHLARTFTPALSSCMNPQAGSMSQGNAMMSPADPINTPQYHSQTGNMQ